MSAFKKTALAAVFAGATLASGIASASALFTFNGGYGASSGFDVISSNVNATSTYTAASPVSSIDQLIGQTNVGLTDISTAGSVNSFLVGTEALLTGSTGSFLTDYTLGFSYSLFGTASIVDGLASGYQDGTLDNATTSTTALAGYGTKDGEIDGGVYLCGAASTSGLCGLDAIVPTFTNGTVNITVRDINTNVSTQVLQLKLVSATSNGQNVVLKTVVDYSWYTDGTSALVENFANFVTPIDGETNWYELWKASTAIDPIEIAFRTDFNIDPNLVPTTAGCANNPTGAASTTLCRTTNLNLTSVVTIPEPGSLALIGLGLLGLAGTRRKVSKS